MHDHAPGELVGNRYRIEGVLGRGGIGTTYLAEDIELGSRVAIKRLWLWHQHDWKVLELFEREARVLAGLTHPAIPRYLGHFQTETEHGPCFYLVQTLAAGRALSARVDQGWRPDERTIRWLADELLKVLEYLHSLSPPVIHRDIKPENLVLADDQRLFLVDFGAVRDTYRSTVSHGSTVVGTFGYMAPEQFTGHAVPATDLYGTGALLVYLLTQLSTAQLTQKNGRIDFRRHVKPSPGFALWLDRMLEPRLERRFESAAQARQELGRCDSARRRSALRLVLTTAAASLVVVPAAAAAGLYLWPQADSGETRPDDSLTPWRGPTASSGRLRLVRTLSGHWSAVLGLAFTRDGSRLVTTSNDSTVKLWNVDSGEVIRSFVGHRGRVDSAAISPNDELLLTSGRDGVRIWDLETGAGLRAPKDRPGEPYSVAISADGIRGAAGYGDGHAVIFKLADATEERSVQHGGRVFGVAFTPDSRQLVTSGHDGKLRVWSVSDGSGWELGAHRGPISDIVVSPDGETVASAGDDRLVKIWSLRSRRLMRALEGHRDEAWSAGFAPDGKLLVSSGKDGVLKLWDVYSGAGKEHVDANPRGVIRVRFTPNGKRIAAATGANTVQLWDLVTPSWRPPVISSPVAHVKKKVPDDAPEAERLLAQAQPLLDDAERFDSVRRGQTLLRQALAIDPKLAGVHVGLAIAEHRLGFRRGMDFDPESLKRAHAHVDRALELDPKSFDAQLRRAYIFRFQADIPRAQAAAERAREIEPDNVRLPLFFARLANQRNAPDEAAMHARVVIEKTDDPQLLAAAYSELLDVYRARQEWDASDEIYRSLLALEPDSAWTRGNYASFLNRRGRWDDAIAMAKQALEKMDYPMGRLTLANAYAGKAGEVLSEKTATDDRLATAEKLIEQAFETHPRCADAHYARGLLQLRRKNDAAARRDFRRALELEKDHRGATAALAQLDR
jgi:WD40 repeat protein/Tfp pilus assembly protein PilF